MPNILPIAFGVLPTVTLGKGWHHVHCTWWHSYDAIYEIPELLSTYTIVT